MEYGSHCKFSACNRLDFLPIQCDGCKMTFCSDHYSYDAHSCNKRPISRDIQIPVCPICGQNVPFLNGMRNPDQAISAHIDGGCRTKKKKSANRCSMKGCKKKELIPITCRECNLNFCLHGRLGILKTKIPQK